MKTPNITISRTWTVGTVQQACINNDLYTAGDNEDYEQMP